jgi:hypothetical protein
MDAHYSTDGGQTWQAAPVPQNTLGPGFALWSGSYLYLLIGQNKDNGQHGSFQVSADGGQTFAPIDLATLAPGQQNVGVLTGVASAAKIYLTIGYSGCGTGCMATASSADGGRTWTHVPTQSQIILGSIQGNYLYGTDSNSSPDHVFLSSIVRSIDGGATWSTITFPPAPSGPGIDNYVVAADQTIFADGPGSVFALHGGAWSTYPVSSSTQEGLTVSAISVGTDGHPQKIWGHDESNYSGIYWHSA